MCKLPYLFCPLVYLFQRYSQFSRQCTKQGTGRYNWHTKHWYLKQFHSEFLVSCYFVSFLSPYSSSVKKSQQTEVADISAGGWKVSMILLSLFFLEILKNERHILRQKAALPTDFFFFCYG